MTLADANTRSLICLDLPDTEPPWFSMPTEGEYSADLEEGTPYDMGYKVDEE